jgi:hypothetical protein
MGQEEGEPREDGSRGGEMREDGSGYRGTEGRWVK